MTLASNYAITVYGGTVYAMRGAAAYPFSTSETVTGFDSPAALLQASPQTLDEVAAGDMNTYVAVNPFIILPAGSETRQQSALQEKRQYGINPENRSFTT